MQPKKFMHAKQSSKQEEGKEVLGGVFARGFLYSTFEASCIK